MPSTLFDDASIKQYEAAFAAMQLDGTPSIPDGDNSLVKHHVGAFPAKATLVLQAAPAKGYTLGLSTKELAELRRCVLRAAYVALHNAPAMHYTEGSLRWSGIADDRRSVKGEFPPYADCSSASTWYHWDASRWLHLGDYVNGASWQAGYTGTMTTHGLTLASHTNLLSGDSVFYGGSASIPSHTAVYVGNGRVISHGSEIGPLLLAYNYRSDIVGYRGYLR